MDGLVAWELRMKLYGRADASVEVEDACVYMMGHWLADSMGMVRFSAGPQRRWEYEGWSEHGDTLHDFFVNPIMICSDLLVVTMSML